VIAGESGFDVAQFLNGAQAAYRMTLEASWKGDEDALADLVEADVLGAFAEAIEQRRAAGQTLDNRLIRIESAKIVDAQVQGAMRASPFASTPISPRRARCRRPRHCRFAERCGRDARRVDLARTLKSGDPNWKLIDTDEAWTRPYGGQESGEGAEARGYGRAIVELAGLCRTDRSAGRR
jgi:hypothetical protein